METHIKEEKVDVNKHKGNNEKKNHLDQLDSKEDVKNKSIHHKLIETYKSEYLCQTNKNICTGSHILKKLVTKEKLNFLVLTLLPNNKGFSLQLKTPNSSDSPMIYLSYDEKELLEYIDNEQLPPILVELLEKSKENMFYSGCVIVEVRNFRKSENLVPNYTLLRPTNQSLISDLHQITNFRWSHEEKLALEASLIMATSEPICLDPSSSVTYLLNKINLQRNLSYKPSLKRALNSISQLSRNKKVKLLQCNSPKSLTLYDFIKKHKPSPYRTLKPNINTFEQSLPELEVPKEINVEKYARPLAMNNPSTENDVMEVEEYIMEVQDKNCGKVSFTHITILQNSIDEQYMGKLYIGRDGQDSGTSCVFKLGDQVAVQKYIDQFTEIFTEKGRRSVKITHLVPGHAPSISFTQGAKENMAEKFMLPNLTAAPASSREHPKVPGKPEEPSSPESSPIDVTTTSQDCSPPPEPMAVDEPEDVHHRGTAQHLRALPLGLPTSYSLVPGLVSSLGPSALVVSSNLTAQFMPAPSILPLLPFHPPPPRSTKD